jgi:hypothetical protein
MIRAYLRYARTCIDKIRQIPTTPKLEDVAAENLRLRLPTTCPNFYEHLEKQNKFHR